MKYANSQTYVEDYISELAVSKNRAGIILREYHDADVLIIDDIQNIIGKTQSIENFFSLMDEFIRNNKKIAIASDRAPKNLGMDERLTSRFNAGMPRIGTRLRDEVHDSEAVLREHGAA